MKSLNMTAVREISNPDKSVYLFDLYNNDGTFNYKPCLVFENVRFNDTWDNETYLLAFFRAIKKNKKKQIKELRIFCRENNLNFDKVITDLLDIYRDSKRLKFWK